MNIRLITICLLVLTCSQSILAQREHSWPGFAGGGSGVSIALDGPDVTDANSLAWVSGRDPWDPQYMVDFEWASTPVVNDGKVYAYAHFYDENGTHTGNQIIAYDTAAGQVLWAAVTEKAYMDSWSSPCIDAKRNTVIIGSGKKVYAFDANSGTELWRTQLDKPVVNASVCVADGLTGGRAFITDYSPYSDGGKLYCINLDPNMPGANSYDPGEIVWADQIGATSGNTPAYRDGVVYVACVSLNSWESDGQAKQGAVSAYLAAADQPFRFWRTSSEQFEGFFGGVAVVNEYVYAANYDFYGTGDNSALCKLNASTGEIVWITQTERTNSVPVVVGDMIFISGGVKGFGSRAKITAYQDLGETAVKLWETPDTMAIGGSTMQLAYANGKLYAGGRSADAYSFDPFSRLYVLDAELTPAEPDFVTSRFVGCGSSCAVTVDSIYSTGLDGLHRFYQQAFAGDVNGDGVVNSSDMVLMLGQWLGTRPAGTTRMDLNLDGSVDMQDFVIFVRDRAGDTN